MIRLNHRFIFMMLALTWLHNYPLFTQSVPHPVKNSGVYDFLDELAGDHIIDLISAVKPYSRALIAEKLKEAENKQDALSPRQKKELDFYLLDFRKELNAEKDLKKRKDLFYYKDSLFSLTVNPILGGELFTNTGGKATYWRNGLEARAYVGNFGFYASLRDNHEKPLLGLPLYLTRREGGHIKESTDWSEMTGGVTWAWKWGNAGLIKENLIWGNNYNGANIFGGNNPSYIKLVLNLNPVSWFSFSYFHGWLNSMVVDSARSYWVSNSYGTDYREVYHKKMIAGSLFTFTPFKYLNISAGNSIIYDNQKANPAFLIPVFFYKSVDHSVSSGIDNMNSQMFFDISTRQIRNLHIYTSVFIDELSVKRIFTSNEWNFLSYKAGFRLGNFPVPNLFFTTEFTYTYPLAFQHYVPTLTFETNKYNLGHYLRDNSREWYAALNYRPIANLDIGIFVNDAVRGPDYTELGGSRIGNPPLENIAWQNTSFGLKASYQIINDFFTWLSFIHNNISGDPRWSPDYYFGNKNTLNAGISFGF